MIEWWLIVLVENYDPDPTMLTPKHIPVTERECREVVKDTPYLGTTTVWAEGKEWKVRVEFCVWTKDRVIQNFVEHGKPM